VHLVLRASKPNMYVHNGPRPSPVSILDIYRYIGLLHSSFSLSSSAAAPVSLSILLENVGPPAGWEPRRPVGIHRSLCCSVVTFCLPSVLLATSHSSWRSEERGERMPPLSTILDTPHSVAATCATEAGFQLGQLPEHPAGAAGAVGRRLRRPPACPAGPPSASALPPRR
jgi:hypothetical protein